MYDQDIVLKYLNSKDNCKLNFKNVKFQLINLHMWMAHVTHNLKKKTFTFAPLGPKIMNILNHQKSWMSKGKDAKVLQPLKCYFHLPHQGNDTSKWLLVGGQLIIP